MFITRRSPFQLFLAVEDNATVRKIQIDVDMCRRYKILVEYAETRDYSAVGTKYCKGEVRVKVVLRTYGTLKIIFIIVSTNSSSRWDGEDPCFELLWCPHRP